MENKLLIPICIPTCNRYEHLKRCVESLSKCTLASETDLIISVDYPPSDKYVDGNEKIKKWLERGIEGFNSVQIFFQEKNLGAYDNAGFLSGYAVDKYKGIVILEDDNELSPCFLEYLNECYKIIEKDENVISASGFCSLSKYHSYPNNISYVKTYSAWGTMVSSSILKTLNSELTYDYLTNIIKSKQKSKKLLELSEYRFVHLVYYVLDDLAGFEDKNEMLIDIFISIYMAIEDKYQIQPHECLVKNWGNDGSGVHCLSDNSYIESVQISDSKHFNIEYKKEYDNRKIEEKQLFQDSRVFSDRQVKWFIFLSEIFRLFGKDTAKSLHFFVKNFMKTWEDSRLRKIYKAIRR